MRVIGHRHFAVLIRESERVVIVFAHLHVIAAETRVYRAVGVFVQNGEYVVHTAHCPLAAELVFDIQSVATSVDGQRVVVFA